jgi:L-cysteine:1D-myo-inositol 2-amino-2-deoxy-alpha-D-glucopyranoside ligase
VKSWNRVEVPHVPGDGIRPSLWNTATRRLEQPRLDGDALLYVCGITPYDATHLGHAATYLAFDTLVRVWMDAGVPVRYTQNVTDVDDPLLARATAIGVDWRELAEQQTALFRSDMAALGILPPDHFVAVTDDVALIADRVARLVALGLAYPVPTTDSVGEAPDLYFDTRAASANGPWRLGDESGLDPDTMLRLSEERGGDPDRPGKRDRLDPLLWRSARAGEPSWPSAVGSGRPGWHIECAAIALDRLGETITVQGGGSDLAFPHHEFTAGHASALTGHRFAQVYLHAGMVGLDGEKMSKSLGNLVLVSRLRGQGVDPRAIRLALLAGHYRSDREWTPAVLETAERRLDRWRTWAADVAGSGDEVVRGIREALADDLDTPSALLIIDESIASGAPATSHAVVAIHALLGIDLRD